MNLAIIGGSGSSGTTLLAHLVSRHSAVASGPEMNFFCFKEVLNLSELTEHIHSLFEQCRFANGYKEAVTFLRGGKTLGIDQARLAQWVSDSNNLAELYQKFTDYLRFPHCADLFVEKTPTNVYNFYSLAQLFPDLPLIHQIRDGRDVVVSLMARKKTLFEAGSRWLYDTVTGLRARGTPGYLETRYEQLVTDPKSTLSHVFGHLGIPFETGILSASSILDKSAYLDDWRKAPSGEAWQQTPSDPISTASVGRYRQVLTQAQLSMLYRIRLTDKIAEKLDAPICSFAELLSFLGYANDSTTETGHKRMCRTTELTYEFHDYLRRMKLYYRCKRRLPQRMTKIAS